MKPLLRTLLAIDAVIVLLFGAFFVLTPWLPDYPPVAGFASSPAIVGQLLGVFLLGFAWLLANASLNGALSAQVARITGRTLSVAGIVVLVWQIVFNQPELTGPLQSIGVIVGIVVLLLGLLQAQLGWAVRRRDRQLQAGAVSAQRAEARAAHHASAPTRGTGIDADPYLGTPAAAASRDTASMPTDTGIRTDATEPYISNDAHAGATAGQRERDRHRDLPPSF